MRFTIGKKLSFGFGFVLLSLLLVATVAKVGMSKMRTVTSEAIPAVELTLKLQREINHALSMHRASMILGLPELAESRLKAWEEIDGYITELDRFAQNWDDASMTEDYARFKAVMTDFRAAQQRIADISGTPADHPAEIRFFEDAEPHGEEMVRHLQAILDLEESIEGGEGDRKLLVRRVSGAEGHLLKARVAISTFLVSGDEGDLEGVWDAVSACQASVDRLTKTTGLLTAEQTTHFNAYLASRERFLGAAKDAVAIRAEPDHCISEHICLNEVTPLANEATALIGGIAERQNTIKVEAIAASERAGARASVVMWSATGVALVAGVGIAVMLGRSISRGLGAVARYADRIASKDLSVAELDVRSNDEIGQLAVSVKAMHDSLREIIGDVNRATAELAGAVTEISASNEEMAVGMEEQTREIEQICGAITELSASSDEVNDKARSASASAEESGREASEGGETVRQTISGMRTIDEAVSGSAEAVRELGRRSEQIGQIVQTINDIADQTNLLALNAAIEAARAGEHGRGFAVVADEVRKLAERTTEATEEVSESIAAIQAGTGQAVERMESGTRNVQEGVALAGSAGASLERIVASADSLTDAVAAIATSAGEQSVASGHVSESIERIRAVVQRSNEATRQASQATRELSHKSEDLHRMVARFTL